MISIWYIILTGFIAIRLGFFGKTDVYVEDFAVVNRFLFQSCYSKKTENPFVIQMHVWDSLIYDTCISNGNIYKSFKPIKINF